MSDRADRHGENDPKYNLIGPLQRDGNTIAIIGRFVSCEFTPGSNESYSLQSIFRTIQNNTGSQPSSDKVVQAFTTGLSTLLSQLSSNMHTSQGELHKAKIFHFDTALRNFMATDPIFDNKGNLINISAKIIDYGLSKQIVKGGVDLAYMGNNMPWRSMDINSLDYYNGTIATDLFAIKSAMISLMGIAAGAKDDTEVLFFKDPNNPTIKMNPVNARRADNAPYANDTVALKAYIDNAKETLNQCKNPVVGKEIKLFLQCYENYLLSMPSPNMSSKEAKKADKKLLLNANALFIGTSVEQKLNNIGAIRECDQAKLAESLLVTQRLLAIPTRNSFKKTDIYKNLLSLNTTLEQEIHSRELLQSHYTAKSSDVLHKSKWQRLDSRFQDTATQTQTKTFHNQINKGKTHGADEINSLLKPPKASNDKITPITTANSGQANLEPEKPASNVSQSPSNLRR